MPAIITNQGAELIAKQQAKGDPLVIKNFVFAHIDGLDTNQTPSESEALPNADKIQYSQAITKAGYVNPAQVVYSVIVGSDVGDWSYNWLGLQADDGSLFAVAYIPTQQKVKNNPPQMGNTITRNFLISFDGAKSITEITVPAEAWQFDITDKLDDMDERNRLAMSGIYGRSTFFNDAFKVVKNGALTQVSKGVAYIEGIRIEQLEALTITPEKDKAIYLDVFLQRQDNIKKPVVNMAYGDTFADYTDNTGTKHYLIIIADSTLTDTRNKIINANSLIEAIEDDPDGDPTHIASIKALQRLKEGLVVNTTDISDSKVELTKEQRGIININASTKDIKINLPMTIEENKGVEYTIRRVDNTSHRVTINATSVDKILFHLNLDPSGFKFFELIGAGDYWTIYCQPDVGWIVTARYDSTPIGVLQPYMSAVMPSGGYFAANRQVFNTKDYPWLLAYANQSGIVTSLTNLNNANYMGFWVVDETTNKLYSPNVGGEFIRALDMGRGIDASRVAGSSQGDAIRDITGTIPIDDSTIGLLSGAFKQGEWSAKGHPNDNMGYIANFKASYMVPTAAENRPRNIAYPYIFKAI